MANISARISRSLVTVIFLSFIQVVAGPILVPQVSTPVAEATTAGITTDGLVLDWNASDSVDRTNVSGVIPTYTTSGGGYYELNGESNYIFPTTPTTVGNVGGMRYLSAFMWVYPRGAGQLLTQQDGTTLNCCYHTAIMEYTSTDQLHIGLWNGGDQTSVNLSTTIATPKNNWYLVGLVYDGTKINGYINGVFAGSTSTFTYSPPGTAYYGIGANDITNIIVPESKGNMRVGGLYIYNKALSAAEAQSNFAATTGRYGPTVSNPSNAATFVNRTATFTSSACSNTTSGSATCNYEWQRSTDGGTTWNFISGANSFTYTTPILTSADNGNRYRLYAWDPGTGTTTAGDLYSITSAVTLTVTTPPGSDTDSALSLNGSTQYAEISDTTGSPFDTSGTFTIQAWVNPATGCASSQTVIAKYLSYMLECYNGYWWYMNIANGSTGSDAATLIKVEQDEWHHIALTRSAGSQNLNFYYDGVLVQTLLTGVTNMTPNNQPFRIGQYNNNYFFNGQIDEVRIYNSQRTQAQIVQDMNSYGNVNDSELMVYYDFNEFTGSKLYNRKAGATSGSDLNILNSPLWKDVKIVDPLSLPAYTIVKFPRSYLTVTGGWRVPTGATRVSALVVAGGGGGGARAAGGGGAGGLVYRQTLTLSVGAVESITVGHGGLGGYSMPTFTNRQGLNGGDSQLGTHTGALGGGGGGGAGDAGNTYRVGLNGGSGGGASGDAAGNGSSAAFGYGQQASSKGYGLGSNGGSGMSGTYWNGGGGGGSGGAGQNASTTSWVAGNGGAGTLDPVGGSNLCLAAGGGGGTINTGTSAGAGGICASGTVTAGAGTVGAVIAGSATANSGSGGGGSGYQTTDVGGGHGGSGVIIIRWITASKPIFTQPTNDTTTAGITDTITVSANPISPLTRNYRWQVSTDTGTTWVNASTGSGITSNTYTTPILDTSTSGSRVQYRVVVTDSDTAGLFIVDTSTAVFIVINPAITFSGTFTSQKYGEGDSDTFTVLNGTGNKTVVRTSSARTGITWNFTTLNTAVVNVAPTVSVGTYLETITATDTRGAQTQLLVSVVVTKADTITVTALDRSDTYTGSALTFTPTFTVVGLKNSDTVTPISWEYTGADNAGTTYSTSTTRPMNAGSYTINPVTPLSLLDSYTAVTRVTSTITISRATRTISMTAPTSPLKYGETRTVIATPSAGSLDGTVSYLTSTSDSCTITSSTIRAVQSAGTCSFTATISRGNNFETATTTSPVTTTLTKADTITVQVRNSVTLTYTGSPAASVPTLNIVGLVHTDTATATRLYSHSASAVGAPESYAALTDSSVVPTNVETYTVSATDLMFTSGLASNYHNVVKETSTLIINQANQLPLQIAMYGASVGSSFTIVTDGGSGGGLVTETTTAGSTASNCAISSRVLTMTSTVQSFCNILVTKGASRNFKAETATAQITFYLFIPTVSAPVQGSGPNMSLTGENDVTVDLVGAPTITSLSATTISLSAGGSLTIGGTGFGTSSLTVKFSRDKTVTITPTNGTTIIVPFADIAASGGQSGRIMVVTAGGIGVSVDRLTINP